MKTIKQLITTAYYPSWYSTDDDVIFLGEWCKPFSTKKNWQHLSYTVLPYHLENRETLSKDSDYVFEVIDYFVRSYSEKLNRLHGINRTNNFWSILFAPWLMYNISALYERYLCILTVLEQNNDKVYTVVSSDMDNWRCISKDSWSQVEMLFAQRGDKYNFDIYSFLIKRMGGIKTIPFVADSASVKDIVQCHKINSKKKIGKAISSLKKKFIKLLFGLSNFCKRSTNEIVIAPDGAYFSIRSLLYFFIRLPVVLLKNVDKDIVGNIPVEVAARKSLELYDQTDQFINICGQILPKMMPMIFVEAFEKVVLLSEKQYPYQAKVILSAVSHYAHDVFRFYLASQVEIGAKFCIAQHGGFYGTAKVSGSERIELYIADRFYSWGWKKDNVDNIVPMPGNKLITMSNKISCDINGDVLVCLLNASRYGLVASASPMAGLLDDHYKHIRSFLKHIKAEAISKFNLRLHQCYPIRAVEKEIMTWDMPFKLTDVNVKLYNVLRKCRLVISNYNSTVFLETMAANFPTVIFYDPKYMEHSDDATPYFEMLKEVGVFHSDSEEAANHINEIFDDPMGWWMSKNVQKAKNKFCQQYAYVGKAPIQEWVSELKSQLEN